MTAPPPSLWDRQAPVSPTRCPPPSPPSPHASPSLLASPLLPASPEVPLPEPLLGTTTVLAKPPGSAAPAAAGVLFALLACAGLGCTQLLVRVGTTRAGLSVPLFAAARGVVAASAAAAYLSVARPCFPSRPDAARALARGALGTAAMLCKFFAVSSLPLQEATALIFTSPALTLLASQALLREPATRAELAACAACLMAVAGIATAPASLAASGGLGVDGGADATSATAAAADVTRAAGIAFGLAAALLQATTYVATRWLGGRVHAQHNVFSLALWSLVAGAALLGAQLPGEVAAAVADKRQAGLLIGAGALSYLGASAVNRALQLVSAGTVSILRSLDIPISYLLAWLVLGERVTSPQSIAASIVILLASCVLAFARSRSSVR